MHTQRFSKEPGACLQSLASFSPNFEWEGPHSALFTTDAKLGEGAFGSVYRATLVASGEVFAAKCVELSADEEFADLMHEIDLLRLCCAHPCIVQLYGAIREDSHRLWLMMELCAGGSLRDIMEATGLAFQDHEVAYLMRGACSALSFLHSRQVIHRDVKAANLLLTAEGAVKLTDFGISKQTMHSGTSTLVGTPLWMAPEIAGAKYRACSYDCRVDVWSLGITAIELVDGVPPHAALRPALAMVKIASAPPPTVQHPEDVAEELLGFIAECLVKDAAARPSAEALMRHPLVEGAPPSEVMAKSVRRYRKVLEEEERKERARREGRGGEEGMLKEMMARKNEEENGEKEKEKGDDNGDNDDDDDSEGYEGEEYDTCVIVRPAMDVESVMSFGLRSQRAAVAQRGSGDHQMQTAIVHEGEANDGEGFQTMVVSNNNNNNNVVVASSTLISSIKSRLTSHVTMSSGPPSFSTLEAALEEVQRLRNQNKQLRLGLIILSIMLVFSLLYIYQVSNLFEEPAVVIDIKPIHPILKY